MCLGHTSCGKTNVEIQGYRDAETALTHVCTCCVSDKQTRSYSNAFQHSSNAVLRP